MFSIVIPLFNEEENIISLLDEIYLELKNIQKYEIVLVNDCSTDNTLELISNYTKHKKIKIINNKFNKGQSYSMNKGIVNSFYDTIITLDGDGQNNPKDIPNLLKIYEKQKERCLVGGIRLNRKDNLIKIMSSKIANSIRSAILQDNCSDTGCSLKIFSKNDFIKLPYFDGIHRFLPALFKNLGCILLFVNVDHRKRKYGYSKYGTLDRLIKGVKDLFYVLKVIKTIKNYK